MVYPLFEYTLLAYIILNYLQIRNDYDKGIVRARTLRTAQVLFWVKIVLVAWFRMIFVVSVEQDGIPFFGKTMSAVVGHTAGFIGMQVALILIAFENVAYIYYSDQRVFRMSPYMTKIAAAVYLVSLTVFTVLKVSWAISLFATGTGWLPAPGPGIVDRLWMVLAAFFPMLFAVDGMRTEPDMHIIIENIARGQKAENGQDDDDNFHDEDLPESSRL